MATVVKSMSDLSKVLESRIKKALEMTALEAQKSLYQCIDEQYYKDPGFYPNVYKRTEEFLKHAAYQMVSSNIAEIYIDIEGMHYKTNFSPWQVVKWASESKHGAEYYQTENTDFWTKFIDWCNDNLINILKNNLIKQGLKIKV